MPTRQNRRKELKRPKSQSTSTGFHYNQDCNLGGQYHGCNQRLFPSWGR